MARNLGSESWANDLGMLGAVPRRNLSATRWNDRACTGLSNAPAFAIIRDGESLMDEGPVGPLRTALRTALRREARRMRKRKRLRGKAGKRRGKRCARIREQTGDRTSRHSTRIARGRPRERALPLLNRAAEADGARRGLLSGERARAEGESEEAGEGTRARGRNRARN